MFGRVLFTNKLFFVSAAAVSSSVAIFKFDARTKASCQQSEYLRDVEKAIAAKKDRFDIRDEDEELEWDIKKENCAFCKMFIDSPCRINFQRWSKCVDYAKTNDGDFINDCKSYTESLVACTSDNAPYFEALRQEQAAKAAQETQDSEEEDEEEEYSGVGEGEQIAESVSAVSGP